MEELSRYEMEKRICLFKAKLEELVTKELEGVTLYMIKKHLGSEVASLVHKIRC